MNTHTKDKYLIEMDPPHQRGGDLMSYGDLQAGTFEEAVSMAVREVRRFALTLHDRNVSRTLVFRVSKNRETLVTFSCESNLLASTPDPKEERLEALRARVENVKKDIELGKDPNSWSDPVISASRFKRAQRRLPSQLAEIEALEAEIRFLLTPHYSELPE